MVLWKHLRAHLQLDEGDVCGTCVFQGSCDWALLLKHSVKEICLLLKHSVKEICLLLKHNVKNPPGISQRQEICLLLKHSVKEICLLLKHNVKKSACC
uniref:Uncharacterized protein n=1 Tax=Helianthus annuus TaxID=4232 RepID=A0A251SER1_HELAN